MGGWNGTGGGDENEKPDLVYRARGTEKQHPLKTGNRVLLTTGGYSSREEGKKTNRQKEASVRGGRAQAGRKKGDGVSRILREEVNRRRVRLVGGRGREKKRKGGPTGTQHSKRRRKGFQPTMRVGQVSTRGAMGRGKQERREGKPGGEQEKKVSKRIWD